MFGFDLHLNLSRFTHILIVVLLCLLLALFNSNLFAASAENEPARSGACSEQGEITEDTLWSPSDCNPYTVVGSLVVIEEVTLTIEPGTTVKFDNNKGLTVHGTLVAQGTEGNSITFTANQPNPVPGDWDYIYFSPASIDATFDGQGDYVAGSIIQHAIIEYGGGATITNDGAIRLQGAAPFIDNNIIHSNLDSGVIVWQGDDNIARITNNQIMTQTQAANGAGIHINAADTAITGNTITDNSASGRGGGIYVNGGLHTINQNVIQGNHANSQGGGIYLNGTATIDENIVLSNTVNSNGAGLFLSGNNTVMNNTVANNMANSDGAGLFLSGNNTVMNNTVANNMANRDGGGIYAGGTLIMNNNTISNNQASRYGGGFAGSGNHLLDGNTINDNIATFEGGGINLLAAGTTGQLINNVIIHNQTESESGKGGGIYLCNNCRPVINDNDIYGNESVLGDALYNNNVAALVNTSAIDRDVDATNNYWGTTNIDAIEALIWHFFDDGSRSVVDFIPYRTSPIGPPPSPTPAITPTPIAQCEVAGWLTSDTTWSPSQCSQYIAVRSVVVPQDVTLTIEPGTIIRFDNKRSLRVEGMLVAQGTEANRITFTSNLPNPESGDWGYIYFPDSAIDATFDGQGNYSDGSVIQYAIIEYAAGTITEPPIYNGSLRLEDSAPFIDNNTTENNVQNIRVWGTPGVIVRITNNTISNNGGGGIFINGPDSVVSDNTIMNNSGPNGGGIYISGGTHTISNNMITDNTAGAGGGMYVNGSATIEGNTVISNTATSDGGGVYMTGNHTFSNNTVHNNTANRDAGGILASGGTASIISNSITENRSFRFAGGILADGNDFINFNTIDNNLVDSNTETVEERGGGIYLPGGGTDGEIRDNIITNNRTTNPLGKGGGIYLCNGCRPTILSNNIYDNQSIEGDALFNTNAHTLQQGTTDVDADNNWWGTTSEDAIEERIWHYWDNSSLSEVLFEPYCQGPCSGEPTPTLTPTPVTPTVTPNATHTPSITPTPTNTLSPTATNTPGTPSLSPTATNAPGTPSLTPTATNTPGTPSLSPTVTMTPGTPSLTPTPTATRLSPTATNTPGTPSLSPTATNTPGTPSLSPTATNTPGTPSLTPTPTATRTIGGFITFTPVPNGTNTPVATATAIIEPEDGGTVTSPDEEVVLDFPSGAVDSTTTIIYNELSQPSQSTAQFIFAGTSFSVEAFDENNEPVEIFEENFTLTLHYDGEDWINAGIKVEEDLSLFYWDGSQWVDLMPCDGCSHNTTNNTLTIMLNHLTEFALLAENELSNQLYLPLINR